MVTMKVILLARLLAAVNVLLIKDVAVDIDEADDVCDMI